MKRWLLPVPVICVLYALNRWTLGYDSGTVLHVLRAGYFADLLAGALILCVANALLAWGHIHQARIRPMERPETAAGFLLLCGLFWEYVTPLYRPDSVSDPWDVATYLLGGLLCLTITRN